MVAVTATGSAVRAATRRADDDAGAKTLVEGTDGPDDAGVWRTTATVLHRRPDRRRRCRRHVGGAAAPEPGARRHGGHGRRGRHGRQRRRQRRATGGRRRRRGRHDGHRGTGGGAAGRGGTTGTAGTGGAAGRGGTTGTAGTGGAAGRGGTTGAAGTSGAAGRGGTTGTAGTGGAPDAAARVAPAAPPAAGGTGTGRARPAARPGRSRSQSSRSSQTAGCGYTGGHPDGRLRLRRPTITLRTQAGWPSATAPTAAAAWSWYATSPSRDQRVTVTLVGSCTDPVCAANPNQATFPSERQRAYQLLAPMNQTSLATLRGDADLQLRRARARRRTDPNRSVANIGDLGRRRDRRVVRPAALRDRVRAGRDRHAGQPVPDGAKQRRLLAGRRPRQLRRRSVRCST